MTLKEWYILIAEKQEGPYSIADLRKDSRITPDTLVWKEGFDKWIPLREVAELRRLFEGLEEEQKSRDALKGLPNDDTLALRSEPPYFYLWIALAIISITYAFYQLFSARH
jgi:hypothetical protein